ncbi:MAG: hypothetical protein JWQ23_2522 [Herminiimonas sp.]|nr:hypothetical protein [Herminiimonas sp.]
MRLLKSSFCIIASLACLLPGYAMAQDDEPREWGIIAGGPAAAAASPVFGNAIAGETLQSYRGGSEHVKSEMKLAGTTAQNSAEQVYTGANSINAGSFANASGIPIVIQNSGANVLIQNATILNLQIH